MLTLNQIKILLTDFFNSHNMINSVYYMDDFDFNAESSIDYPVVNIEYLNSAITDKVFNHNFKIVIGDITVPDNYEMEDMVHSDTLQIAEDFFTFLQNYNGNLIFDRASSIQKFVDDTGDRICGIVFTIRLGTIRAQNTCFTDYLQTKNN
jgi:hypothetical protein